MPAVSTISKALLFHSTIPKLLSRVVPAILEIKACLFSVKQLKELIYQRLFVRREQLEVDCFFSR